jgi:hypothetical protein
LRKKLNSEEITYVYQFNFEDGSQKDFKVVIDANTLLIKRDNNLLMPEWTKLKNFRCPHCPLDGEKIVHCPVAVNLVDVIEEFYGCASYDRVDIKIITEARQYYKKDSLQVGVSGFIGILMVTSGCPIMGKLKPMVKFHLPFASLEETEYRVLSMYMLAQYFLWKRGNKPDWEFENLTHIYEDIRILNQNVCKRIADLEQKDTSINSVVVLNNFADYVSFNIDQKMMDEVEMLFDDYFK